MSNDLRYGLRMLVRSPGFYRCSGAVTSTRHRSLLKMLPVKNPEQLVLLNWLGPHQFSPRSTVNANTTTDEQSGLKMISAFSYPTFEKFTGPESGVLTSLCVRQCRPDECDHWPTGGSG